MPDSTSPDGLLAPAAPPRRAVPDRAPSSSRGAGPGRGPGRSAGRRVGALALTALVALSACVAPKEQTTPAVPGETAPADLTDLADQEVTWEACEDFECATVQAPLDWEDPEAGTIELALKRAPATGSEDQRIGSLLINPGGPGGSGVEYLDYAVTTFGDRLLEAYDVVGFDPRGVGASTAVECSDERTDGALVSDPPRDEQELQEARDAIAAWGEDCRARTGPLLEHVDTVSAAKDMELLRQLLGDEKLHYAGFSYGTYLGATYADLFPDRVGRLLLDGALDPTLDTEAIVTGQAEGFETALRAYVESCQAGPDCPLPGDVEDGLAAIAGVTERAERRPLETAGGAPVNGRLAYYGIAVALYDDTSWPYLTMALDEVLTAGTGDTLLQLANFYLDRTPEAEYTSNSMAAFQAINCLDYPTEPPASFDELVASAEELAKVAPTFARDFVVGAGCETWPVTSTAERRALTAPGAAPILVVGTTGDPATPYEWSVGLAEQLESGVLLTYEGEGHTAYGRGNSCIQETVDAYLVDGTVPEDGTVC